MYDCLEWIRDGFFYSDMLQKALISYGSGNYKREHFRAALIEGLSMEVEKYTCWSISDGPGLEGKLKDARIALAEVKRGKSAEYKNAIITLNRTRASFQQL